MAVKVVCDSAASLSAELAGAAGVVVVPMQIEIDGQPVPEAEVKLEELVARLDDPDVEIKTSGPAPGAFAELLEEICRQDGDGVVVVTVGSRFSSTYQSAVVASNLVDDPTKVRVVETGTAAGAEGLVVLAAANLAASGAALDEVAAKASEVAGRVRLVASVEQLTYLVKGGRLPAGAARAGDRLGVRVLFGLSGGKLHPMLPAFGAGSAHEAILSAWRKSIVEGANLHIAALHAMRPQEAESLLADVRAEVEPVTAFVGTFGPVMVAHTGPGVTGLAWWWEEPQ